MDSETAQVQAEGQMIADYVNSDGWRWVKDRLEEMLRQVDSISSLPEGLTKEQKLEEMERRQGAISLVRDWIGMVEGRASQHANNNPVLVRREEEIILIQE